MVICIAYKDYMKYAYICLMYAGICDMLDGFVARKCKRTEEEKAFGVQIDSLVDVFDFIAFPIVLLICNGLNEWYQVLALGLYGICGVARLGYFNIVTADSSKAVRCYEGLPVTMAALIIPAFYLLKLCVESAILNIVLTVVALIVAILFVLRFNIKKPSVKSYFVFGALAIIVTVVYCLYL